MKIIVAGNYSNPIYAKAVKKTFDILGFSTLPFDWQSYIKKNNIFTKLQNRYHIGPLISKINKDLIKLCREKKPELLFIYRGILIGKSTIKKIKTFGIIVIGYNNDDPFEKRYPFYVWRKFLKSACEYNFIFSFREKNVSDYMKKLKIKSEVLRMYYINERNYPMLIRNTDKEYLSDVVFIGHFEDDGRDEFLLELIHIGITVKLYGTFWDRSKHYYEFVKYLGGPIRELSSDYNLAINSAKIAVVFLSKINNDTYTTRCFEIPATKTFMLCEFSNDMARMFLPNEEAVYFKNKNEFIENVKYYLVHADEREKIAENGYVRLKKDGYEIKDFAALVIKKYEMIKGSSNEF